MWYYPELCPIRNIKPGFPPYSARQYCFQAAHLTMMGNSSHNNNGHASDTRELLHNSCGTQLPRRQTTTACGLQPTIVTSFVTETSAALPPHDRLCDLSQLPLTTRINSIV